MMGLSGLGRLVGGLMGFCLICWLCVVNGARVSSIQVGCLCSLERVKICIPPMESSYLFFTFFYLDIPTYPSYSLSHASALAFTYTYKMLEDTVYR